MNRRQAKRELPVFSRTLAALLDAGLTLEAALRSVDEQTGNPAFRRVVAGLKAVAAQGRPFSVCIVAFPQVFDAFYVSTVRAAEASARLPEALNGLADYFESSLLLRRRLYAALAYPAVILAFAACLAIFMSVFVVPAVSSVYVDMDQKLPVLTRAVVGVSDWITGHWLDALLLTIPLVLCAAVALKTSWGRYLWDACVLGTPGVGGLARKVGATRFALTFAQSLRSGVPIVDGLSLAADATGNRVLAAQLRSAGDPVSRGEPLSTSRGIRRAFPRTFLEMLRTGEQTGRVDEMLEKVAAFYQQEVNTAVKGMTSLLQPVLMIVVGLIVGSMVIGLLLPIVQLPGLIM